MILYVFRNQKNPCFVTQMKKITSADTQNGPASTVLNITQVFTDLIDLCTLLIDLCISFPFSKFNTDVCSKMNKCLLLMK